MKHDLKCGDNCVVCGQELTIDWKSQMYESEFTQSWCLICLLKYGESYPTTKHKIDTIQEINKLQRKYKF